MSRLIWLAGLGIVFSGLFGSNPWMSLLMLILLAIVVPAFAVQVSATLVKGETTFSQSLLFSLVVAVLVAGGWFLGSGPLAELPPAWAGLALVGCGIALWSGSKILHTGYGATALSLLLALVALCAVVFALDQVGQGLGGFIQAMSGTSQAQ